MKRKRFSVEQIVAVGDAESSDRVGSDVLVDLRFAAPARSASEDGRRESTGLPAK